MWGATQVCMARAGELGSRVQRDHEGHGVSSRSRAYAARRRESSQLTPKARWISRLDNARPRVHVLKFRRVAVTVDRTGVSAIRSILRALSNQIRINPGILKQFYEVNDD